MVILLFITCFIMCNYQKIRLFVFIALLDYILIMFAGFQIGEYNIIIFNRNKQWLKPQKKLEFFL